MTKLLLTSGFLVLALASLAKADPPLQCTVYDPSNGASIYGSCNAGQFFGYDPQSGSYLNGSCSNSGVTVYDPKTGAYLFGSCF